ncbi:MAG: methyltransferase domain-containing protein [Candidatus Eisenbacteria bacterium]|nr:methyltransferase domain-containing protein [Candidatus Eisenbacteria bacterium]
MRALGPADVRPGAAAVLDVRGAEAFRSGHLAGSGSIPAGELAPRRAELPPREAPVLVVAESAAAARAAAATLDTMGYRDIAYLDAALAALAGGLADRGPAARLWRPAPFLEEVLPLLPDPRGGPHRALDLAAGSGREAVFLALGGWEVEAWDVSSEALERAAGLARRHGVRLDTVVADLERGEPPLPESAFDLVTCFRFLHRPLFPRIEAALRPGGRLVYETYRLGQARFGRPRRARFLLRDGELRSAFPGLSVERYDEPDPEGGPVTARLLARRP